MAKLTGLVRMTMSIFKSSEDEQMVKINFLDGQMSRLIEVFTVDMQIDTAHGIAAVNALLTSLSEPIKRLVDRSSISTQVLQGSQNLQLLRWLSSVPFPNHHKRHSESRIPGSGQWLLGHDRYLNWRNKSSSSIFLLHGIMGSGKTSLASLVVDSFLQENFGQTSPAPIAYFYCTRHSAEAERGNPDEIMRSILRQLTVSHGSSSTIHERLLREYECRQEVANVDGFEILKLQVVDCVRLILDTTAANPATIVLDAVDEIQPSSRHILLSALIRIVHESLSVVKIFVTSRDDSNIHALLYDSVAVRIQNEDVRKDMDEFVHRELSCAIQNRRMLNGNVPDGLKQSLVSALVAGAGEM
jgi:AAA ATPase domain